MRANRTILLVAVGLMAIVPFLQAAEPTAEAEREGIEAPETDCGEGRVFSPVFDDCVTLPVIRKQVDPVYPEAVAGFSYDAVLQFRVSTLGTVSEVQILKAPEEGEPTEEGEAALTAVVQAVRQWRFTPGLDPSGKPIAMAVSLKVHLRTED